MSNTQTFDQAQAIARYTELMRLVSAGAYEERSEWHYETGTYPEDGVEQGIHDLDYLAAQQGLEFHYHQDSKTYTLEPMSAEDLAAFKAAQAADREELIRQLEHDARVAEITPSPFDTVEDFEEWEMNNR